MCLHANRLGYISLSSFLRLDHPVAHLLQPESYHVTAIFRSLFFGPDSSGSDYPKLCRSGRNNILSSQCMASIVQKMLHAKHILCWTLHIIWKGRKTRRFKTISEGGMNEMEGTPGCGLLSLTSEVYHSDASTSYVCHTLTIQCKYIYI